MIRNAALVLAAAIGMLILGAAAMMVGRLLW